MFKKILEKALAKKSFTRIVTDEIVGTEETRMQVEAFSKISNIEIFKGSIDNAYVSDFTGYLDHCPECNAPTKKMYSGFVYATQTLQRIMSAPAGHFCTSCPTVIIDDDTMRVGVKEGIRYGGTCAIETGYKELNMFKTLNGEKSVYILDPNQNLEGIVNSVNLIKHDDQVFIDPFSGDLFKPLRDVSNKQKQKNRSKNKAAKKSRSQNRKK